MHIPYALRYYRRLWLKFQENISPQDNFIYFSMSVNMLVGKYDIEVCGHKKYWGHF